MNRAWGGRKDEETKLRAFALDLQERRRFEEITLPHLNGLYRLAVRLSGNSQNAEDLVQETYLKALRAFSTLRHPERVRAWLFQILSRQVMDHRRREAREAVSDNEELDRFSLYDQIWDEDPFPYSERLHEDFLAQFHDEEVRRGLLVVPEVYRLPLLLVYVEEMSYLELAEVLGCPMGTVMSRLYRGRKLLREELKDFALERGLGRAQAAEPSVAVLE